MSKKLKAIRKRHAQFKEYFNAKPEWRAEVSVQDLDYLLKKIEKLEAKGVKAKPSV